MLTDQNQLSNELRYSGQFGRVNSTLGVFYYEDELFSAERRVTVTDLTGGGRVDSRQYALFSAFDIALPRDFILNLGARYSTQRKSAQVQRQVATATSPCSITRHSCESYAFSGSDTWSSFTPKLGLEWLPSPSTHLYSFYTRGFRDGGFSVRHSAMCPLRILSWA